MRNIDVPNDTVQLILANCSHFTIQNLTLSNINIGVQLGFSSNNSIKQNIINSNTVNGLYLFNSTKNIIEGNTILTNKRCGIHISSSSQNVIKENNIDDNDYGIVLESSSENKIIKSKFKGNHWSSIVLDTASNENTICNNQIMESGDRSILIIHSSNNLIRENNFIDNQLNPLIYRIYRNYVRDLIDIFHNTFNKWDKNYWNDWPGGIPKPIKLRLNIVDNEDYPIIAFPWLLFDWHPASEPYDIPMLNVK
jgi:parallel beta-helix repeat protein